MRLVHLSDLHLGYRQYQRLTPGGMVFTYPYMEYPEAAPYSEPGSPGRTESYDMVRGGADIPLVPLVVNTAAPPLPSMERCVQLGRAVGAAIRASAYPGRVLLLASGGLASGGLEVRLDGSVRESVADLPVWLPEAAFGALDVAG